MFLCSLNRYLTSSNLLSLDKYKLKLCFICFCARLIVNLHNIEMEATKQMSKTDVLLEKVRSGSGVMSGYEQLSLTVRLAIPAMLAQISHILMEYIDASMVGRLGAEGAASIGLIATTTWLFWGLCSSIATGFSVQVAHKIGASKPKDARSILRQAFTTAMAMSLTLCVVAVAVSGRLPIWLGGDESLHAGASGYFLVFALTIPMFEMTFMMSAMLRCSGNVKLPSMINMLLCVLDVVFNFLFIFPSADYNVLGMSIHVYGAGLGVVGAAVGTAVAEVIGCVLLFYHLCYRSRTMSLFGKLKQEVSTLRMFRPTSRVLKKAFRLGLPIACERMVMCGAQICTTMIVAPLGMFAIAANAFGVNAESLCYMPGYGIADAATTLVGQSVGAKRSDLAKRFAYMTVGIGMAVMTIMGIMMYVAAPVMMSIMTPVNEIIDLGVSALRIEAFAEPLFAASIVCYGAFVGAGDTLIPSSMNLGSIWIFRITLAIVLAPTMGLNGVWLAMCIELCLRGLLFLLRLKSGRWLKAFKV